MFASNGNQLIVFNDMKAVPCWKGHDDAPADVSLTDVKAASTFDLNSHISPHKAAMPLQAASRLLILWLFLRGATKALPYRTSIDMHRLLLGVWSVPSF